MKADYISCKRATERSLLGLGVQLALGITVLIYAVIGHDPAALTASWIMLLGGAVWLCLALVYDQQRRERIEAMEAESFRATDAASSSVFDQSAAELRVAAKRLRTMRRLLVPGVSLACGGALLVIGFLRLKAGWPLASAEGYAPPTVPRGWPIGLGVAVAFAGFVYARYISGMAKQPAWAALRGGASWAAGSALLGLALAIAHFIDVAGPDAAVRSLTVAVPIFAIVLGAEVLLNFVLDLYRPRTAGELSRPAFDSRLLALVAAPDRIAESIGEALNYQFGFNVTSSWFYRLLSRSAAALVLAGALVLWLLTSLAVVQPHQRGMILRFGAVVREDVGPGLHLKMPWPIDRMEVPEFVQRGPDGRELGRSRTATGVRRLDAGTTRAAESNEPILWTTQHAANETFVVVQPSAINVSGADSSAGPDLAVVTAEAPIHYAVRDVRAYDTLGPPETRDVLLMAVAQREVTRYLSTLSIDDVLDEARPAIAAELRRRVDAAFAQLNPDPATGVPRGAGVEILFVGFEGVHPPTSLAPKFEQLIEAEQKAKARVETARAEAVRELTNVVGSVELAGEIAALITERRGITGADAESERRRADLEIRIERLLDRAGGSAAALLAQARADRWRNHLGARAKAERYAGQAACYLACPSYYMASLYFDAFRESVAGARLYLVPDDEAEIRIEMLDQQTSVDVFRDSAVPPPE